MEEFNDLYQKKIDEARTKLPKESREAIDNFNWKLMILGMKNYTEDQLDALEIETELLLYGITKPEDYPYELEKRMGLSQEDTKLLVEKLNRTIFERIKEELELILEKKRRFENKQAFLDPRFSSLPLSIQKAISKSNWRENLSDISQKYQLNIEQMGVLEKVTIKVIKNEISPENYLNELLSNINKTKDELSTIVEDVNKKIILEIRELLKKEQESKDEQKIINDGDPRFDKIPLPPYSRIKSQEERQSEPLRFNPEYNKAPAPNFSNNINFKLNIKEEKNNKENNNQAVVNNQTIPKIEKVEIPKSPKNIIEEKLKGITISDSSIDDTPIKNTNNIKADPYREPF